MNFLPGVLTADATAGGSAAMLIGYVIFFGLLMYFMVFRPQKKQQKKQDELVNSIEIGDSILTTSGFYGVVIDNVDENVVIVEFGNNKNCRIPMKKTAIVEVEKPENDAPYSLLNRSPENNRRATARKQFKFLAVA